MRLIRGLAVAAATVSLLVAPLVAHPCGKQRWSVKVVTDNTKNQIVTNPVPITINKLRRIDAPINPNVRKKSRYAPTELTVYEVTAKLTMAKKESDEDYHLVITDSRGRTMIVEAPAPDCADGSRFATEISDVRKAIKKALGSVTKTKKHPDRVVTVTGVGFFDHIHGQEGVAPNGIELHPLLSIEFHPDSSVDALKKRTHKKTKESDD